MTRTFVDAGVLIAAACGVPEIAESALRFLDDPDRSFVTSDILRLEVLPKPSYHGYKTQVDFYEAFFQQARTIPVSGKLTQDALREACRLGLGACDALHLAAARLGKCEEVLTNEKPTRPLFRASGIRIISLQQGTISS
jgi:predicted nucleic acid-binding protein